MIMKHNKRNNKMRQEGHQYGPPGMPGLPPPTPTGAFQQPQAVTWAGVWPWASPPGPMADPEPCPPTTRQEPQDYTPLLGTASPTGSVGVRVPSA